MVTGVLDTINADVCEATPDDKVSRADVKTETGVLDTSKPLVLLGRNVWLIPVYLEVMIIE